MITQVEKDCQLQREKNVGEDPSEGYKTGSHTRRESREEKSFLEEEISLILIE